MLKQLFKPSAIGIDLGTVNTLICAKNKGVIANEPTIIARNKQTGAIVSVGQEAYRMIGRSPDHLEVIAPLQNGVIHDLDLTTAYLKHLLKQTLGSWPIRANVWVCVPGSITQVERKALLTVLKSLGSRQVIMVDEGVAAAYGANLVSQEPLGQMIMDIGGGTTDLAVVSLGETVKATSFASAGKAIDLAIIHQVKTSYQMIIGERMAEEIKHRIASACPSFVNRYPFLLIHGRDLITNMPIAYKVDPLIIHQAISPVVDDLINKTHQILASCPPDIVSDIMEEGIYLTGGGALLHDIGEEIAFRLQLPVFIAPDPLLSVINGLSKLIHEGKYIPSKEVS